MAFTRTRPGTERPQLPQPTMPGFAGTAPTLRRSRNIPGAVLGALVVVTCSLVVTSLTSAATRRTQVLVLRRPVAAGATIQATDLSSAGVAADSSVRGIRASRISTVVGRIAADNLVPGALLVGAELTRGPVLTKGSTIVGLALKPGFLPSGLTPQDTVAVIATPTGTDTPMPTAPATGTGSTDATQGTLVPAATVYSVAPGPDGQDTLVSIVVPAASAASVAEANARAAVSLVMVGG